MQLTHVGCDVICYDTPNNDSSALIVHACRVSLGILMRSWANMTRATLTQRQVFSVHTAWNKVVMVLRESKYSSLKMVSVYAITTRAARTSSA